MAVLGFHHFILPRITDRVTPDKFLKKVPVKFEGDCSNTVKVTQLQSRRGQNPSPSF